MWSRKIAVVGFVLKTAPIALALTSNASSKSLLQSNDGIGSNPRYYQRPLSAGTSDSNEDEFKLNSETKSPSRVLDMASFLASKLLEKAIIEASKEDKDSRMTADDLVRLMESFQSAPPPQVRVTQSDTDEAPGQDQEEGQQEVQIPIVEEDQAPILDVSSDNVDEKNATAFARNEETNESKGVEPSILRPQTVKDDVVSTGGQEATGEENQLSIESTTSISEATTSHVDPKEKDRQLVPPTSDTSEDVQRENNTTFGGKESTNSDKENAEEAPVSAGTAVMIPSNALDGTEGHNNNITNVSPSAKAGDTVASSSSTSPNPADDGDKLVEEKPTEDAAVSSTGEEESTPIAVAEGGEEKSKAYAILEARIPDVISQEYGRPLEVIASNLPPLRQAYARKSSTPPFVSVDSAAPTPEPSASPSTPPSTSLRSTADSIVDELPVDAQEKTEAEATAMQVVDMHDGTISSETFDDIVTQWKELESLSNYQHDVIPETDGESSLQELEGPEAGGPVHIIYDSTAANEPLFAETTLEVAEEDISYDFAEEQPCYSEDGDSQSTLLKDLKEKFSPLVKNRRHETRGAASLDTLSVVEGIPRRREIGKRLRSNVRNLFRRRRGNSGDTGRSSSLAYGGSRKTRAVSIAKARLQPKPAEEEHRLAERYGGMDLEERAFTILYDLGMIEIHPNPEEMECDDTLMGETGNA